MPNMALSPEEAKDIRHRCTGDWQTCVGRLVIKKARFNELEVGDLTVHRLRVVEHKGSSS